MSKQKRDQIQMRKSQTGSNWNNAVSAHTSQASRYYELSKRFKNNHENRAKIAGTLKTSTTPKRTTLNGFKKIKRQQDNDI